MAEFPDWESYLYPPPDEYTLRNKFGIRDLYELRAFEYAVTAKRELQLKVGHVDVERSFDVEHVRAIHRHLFQDLYEWAGDLRTENMRRPGNPVGFAGIRNGGLTSYLEAVKATVSAYDWPALDHERFTQASAEVFAYLNHAHPFREGNGRSSRVFMDHVAELSAFEFDRTRLTKEEWDRASAQSAPQTVRDQPKPMPLRDVFRRMAVAREDGTNAPRPESVDRSARLLSASFPTAAVDALKAAERALGDTSRPAGRDALAPTQGYGVGE